jgi:hypothetical protein
MSVESFPTSQAIVQPSAEQRFTDPSVEMTARQLLGSYFGPSGLMSQPIPVPVQQTAGLGPLEVMARNMAGGLGGFAPQLNMAQQYYMQSGMGYNPYYAQSFMNPYMQNVYQPQMDEISRLGEEQKRQARSRQVQAGAFGGSRGAIQEAEIDRNVLDKQAQFGGDLLYKGYGDAMDRSMTGFENMQGRRAAAARGISGLGQQGFDMLTSQIGTLGNLGRTGRGIQDTAFGRQYDAATQMADEPYMRFQRGQQMLGGLGSFLPSYTTGYNVGMQGIDNYEEQSRFGRFVQDAQRAKTLFDIGSDIFKKII